MDTRRKQQQQQQSVKSETQWNLTNDVYLHGFLRSSYYCMARFSLDSSACSASAGPCPAGHHGDCPDGTFCFPDTPCADLLSSSSGSGGVAEDAAPAVAPSPSGGSRPTDGVPSQFVFTCTSNDHCPFGQFCAVSLASNVGSCRSCLVGSGMGCSTDEYCRTRTCSDEAEGEERCYSRDELDLGCGIASPGTVCDVVSMECVADAGQSAGSSALGSTLALGNKPAPPPPPPPTRRPTKGPTARPTIRPTARPTAPTFDFSIVNQKPAGDETVETGTASYCGSTWTSVNTLSGCMAR